jgi:integrase
MGNKAKAPDLKFRKAKPKPKPYKITDRDGLYCFVTPKGAKSWRFDYRLAGARETLTIGRYPDLGLGAARDALAAARGLVAQGISPAKSKQDKRAEDQLARKNTFKALAEEWYAAKAPHKSESWRQNARRWFDGDVYPAIGHKPIRAVTAGDVEALVKAIAKKRGAKSAFYARLLIADVFKKQPRSLNLGNPARDVGNILEIPKGEPRGRPLPVKQIPALLKAAAGYTGREQTKLAIPLLLHTFTRKRELIEAPWTEFDLDGEEWTVSPERMKMEKPHIVPLSKQAVQWFRELKKLANGSPYVFPSAHDPKRPMNSSTLNHALSEMGFARFTPHSARSTASTELNKQGWNSEAIELQLAHVERNKTRASYNHADKLEERRRMMQAWADYLDALASGADVVPIRGRAA